MSDPNRQPPARKPLHLLPVVVLIAGAVGGGAWWVSRRPPANATTSLAQRVQAGLASPAEMVRLGREYLDRGETLKAAEMAFRARKADPKLAEAHHLLGVLYNTGGEAEKARASFIEAVRVAPQSASAHLALARFEIEQRSPETAFRHAQTAINLDRNNAEAWVVAGKLQRLMKSDGTSRSSFLRAISLDPRNAEAQMELGVLALDFDNYSEAVAPLQKAYELGDRSPQVLTCLALALLAGPGDEASATRAEQLLADAGQPETPPAWFARGLLLQRRKEFAEARAEFEKVLRLNPRNERAQYALAMTFRDEGKLPEAQKAMAVHDRLVKQRQRLKQLSQNVTANPKAIPPLKAYAIALYEAGNFEVAETQFRAWKERAPQDAEAARWLQRAQEQLRKARSAPK